MKPAAQNGFTLIELAVVLMIVGLLLGGMLGPLTAQLDQRNFTDTRKTLDDIQQALIGYAIINGRLPCPAQADLATGQPNAGVEATKSNTCACKSSSGSNKTVADTSGGKVNCTDTTVTGVLPWVTLGIHETDAWNHRYTYRVTSYFADQISANTFGSGCTPSPSPTTSSFALCSPGVPNVLTATSGSNVATNLPVVFLSHGKNGAGAYLSDGSKIPDGTGDEAENSNNDNSFVSHTINATFDDVVSWVSPNILFNRMVAAGKLP
jgi:prepilin-type N-terminal cleavage/methylation domain-containing protein